MKAEKTNYVKMWIKNYLNEVGSFVGTWSELSRHTNASCTVIKKAVEDLEKEGFLKVFSKKGKGLILEKLSDKKDNAKSLSPLEEKYFQKLKNKPLKIVFQDGSYVTGFLKNYDPTNFKIVNLETMSEIDIDKNKVSYIVLDKTTI
ncbi:MAG TPA: hypothetical protein EYH39_03930 [Desulfurobacteriaceae bacterium]|nr:hypothetical protein [Desulfurobacteriaceae bacterium]